MVQAGSIQHVSLTTRHAEPDEAGSPPRQLPSGIRDFTGRTDYLAALDTLLPTDSEVDGATVVITAVDGAAGIGKTTLAVRWAHRVQDRFPDGTLHVNLRGYGPGEPVTPGEVLEGFLRALGVLAERIPVGTEAKAGLFRSLLARRRVLILLDNANSADQVRPLLPAAPGGFVLVTSRESLTGLVVTEAANRLTLDLLPEDEALQLVAGILGPVRAAAEPDAILDLVQYCARLPLALRIAAAQATAPHTTVADVVAELADDESRLDALSHGGDERAAVRAVFDWSYQRLNTKHARAFRRLGLHPGQEFSVHAAAASVGLDVPEARRVLGMLAQAHLLEPAAKRGRYRFHDLLRTYAADRSERDDTYAEREHARRALLEWYAHHARTAHRVLFPAHRDWHPAQRLTIHTRPEIPLAGREEAWAWFDLERDNLVAAVRDADRHDQTHLTLLLATTTGMILMRRGRWDSQFDVYRRALATARRSGHRLGEVHALQDLGQTYLDVADWERAHDAHQAALELARELGDLWREATALNQLSLGHEAQGQYAQAKNYLLEALPLAAGAQHGRMEGVIESNLSHVYIGLGDYSKALHHADRSLVLRRQAHDREGETIVLLYMAQAHHGMGNLRKAITLCEQALDVEEHYRHPRSTAETLDTLGTLLRDTDDTAGALRCWRQALRTFEDFGDHRANDLRDRLHALETSPLGDDQLGAQP
ncbi:XRE family transcriptional regulator [Crossiella cryophila]